MSDEEDFAAMFEASVEGDSRAGGKKLKAGQPIVGTVVAISDDTIFVDIGARREAKLARSAALDEKLKVAIGDTLKATIAQPEGHDAAILKVAFGGAGVDVAELELALESGTPVEGEFTKAVKGGLEVDVGGRRAFCPASQIDLAYVADLETFVGQNHFFRVIEVRDGGRSIVLSRKALLAAEREERAQALLAGLEEGTDLDGIVQSLQAYGAFVDIGGIQGLVHVSEISHARVSSPSDALSVGEKVRVKVLSIQPNPAGPPRISLSMKALTQPDPDAAAPDAGEIIEATVAKVENFGVVVDTPQGSGLVPTAELDLPPGSDPRRAYKPGDSMDVVLQRREPSGRLRFSSRAVAQAEEKKAFAAFRGKKGGKSAALGSLGDLLQGIDLGSGGKK